MFLGGRLIKNGMWVVWGGKRGILLAPHVDVKDDNGKVIDRDYKHVQFHVVADTRETVERLTPAVADFFASARLAKLKEIPQNSRPPKEHGKRLGYL